MPRYDWGETNPAIERLKDAMEPARQEVISHPLYRQIDNLDAVVTFMEHHVFAVWDFMSLLKTLQRSLTCVEVPWVPTGPTGSRRLINDIVLVEESDELGDGFISHFELYLDGMRQAGADTDPIEPSSSCCARASRCRPSLEAGGRARGRGRIRGHDLEVHRRAPVHCQAAAFAFGREDLIPDMFDQVAALNADLGDRCPRSSTTCAATSRWTARSTPRWRCRCSPTCAVTTRTSGSSARRPSTTALAARYEALGRHPGRPELLTRQARS